MNKKNSPEKEIAFFDFDGTLTYSDSGLAFLKFSMGYKKLLKGILIHSPSLAGFITGIVRREKTKENILGYFFRGRKKEELENLAIKFTEKKIPSMLRPKGLERLSWHKENGHEVVLVSASLSLWLKPWTQLHNIGLIATELEEKDGVFTGKLSTPNCHGPDKVRRIREKYDLSKYSKIYAYGDTKGDYPMLALADEPAYKPFHGWT